jgi:hypothetical protein
MNGATVHFYKRMALYYWEAAYNSTGVEGLSIRLLQRASEWQERALVYEHEQSMLPRGNECYKAENELG